VTTCCHFIVLVLIRFYVNFYPFYGLMLRCGATIQSREVINHWCETVCKILVNYCPQIKRCICCFETFWSRVSKLYLVDKRFYRRIFSTMSFGLSKKSHNLNQYTLLSNLEGMFFVLTKMFCGGSRAISIWQFQIAYCIFCF
jgi:hypothetical protein